MRVLILGGTGLISKAIVKRCLKAGHEVTAYNRGNTKNRIGETVPMIYGNRYDFPTFEEEFAECEYDAVIDMITYDAATAANSVKVFGGRVRQYLFCSTVCVYGGPLTTIPAGENEPHTPAGDYGQRKSEAEAVFMEASRASGFPITVFRPSHCYGPGQPLLDIFGYNATLVSRLRDGKPILVPGDGYGLWQPGHVDDMAKGFAGALGNDALVGESFNLVSDDIMTWRTFHDRMAAALGLDAKLVPMTTPHLIAGAPHGATGMLEEIFQYHAAYSNAKIKAAIPEFGNFVAFEDGVRETVRWLDDVGGHAASEEQAWIEALAEKSLEFEKDIALANADMLFDED